MNKGEKASWAIVVVSAIGIVWLLLRKDSTAAALVPTANNEFAVAEQGLSIAFPFGGGSSTDQTPPGSTPELDSLMASTYGTGVAGSAGATVQTGY